MSLTKLPQIMVITSVNPQTASYSLVESDENTLISINSSSAITVTVPTDATTGFTVGTQIMIVQLGSGQVTVNAATPGTTSVNGANGLKTNDRYSIISLIKVASNSWVVGGDTTV